jgi:hypothetical protein
MGPAILLREAVNGAEWGQCYAQEKMLKTLNGPTVAHNTIETVDRIEQA